MKDVIDVLLGGIVVFVLVIVIIGTCNATKEASHKQLLDAMNQSWAQYQADRQVYLDYEKVY